MRNNLWFTFSECNTTEETSLEQKQRNLNRNSLKCSGKRGYYADKIVWNDLIASNQCCGW